MVPVLVGDSSRTRPRRRASLARCRREYLPRAKDADLTVGRGEGFQANRVDGCAERVEDGLGHEDLRNDDAISIWLEDGKCFLAGQLPPSPRGHRRMAPNACARVGGVVEPLGLAGPGRGRASTAIHVRVACTRQGLPWREY